MGSQYLLYKGEGIQGGNPRQGTWHCPWNTVAAQYMVAVVAVVIFLIFSSILRPFPHFHVSVILSCLTVNVYILSVVFCSLSPQRAVTKSMTTFITKSFSDLRKCGITEFCFPSLSWDCSDSLISLANNLFLKREISKC